MPQIPSTHPGNAFTATRAPGSVRLEPCALSGHLATSPAAQSPMQGVCVSQSCLDPQGQM